MKNITRFSTLIMAFLLSVFMFSYRAHADGVITIGTETGIEQYVPIDDYWMYSWSEIVYQQSDINLGPVLINQIAFQVYSTASTTLKVNQSVYMKNVPYSTITSTDYPDPTNNGYTLVYAGSVDFLTGWVVVTLQTPFLYDGTNLSIVWENRNGAYCYPYTYFYYTYRANSCKYKYQDNSFPAVSGSISYYQANIQIYWATLTGGTLSGTVTDASSGLPIVGAKVTAGNNVTYSLGDGSYSMDLFQGSYTVYYEKTGYNTQSQSIYIAPGSFSTVDIALVEIAVPPSGVVAALRPPTNNVVDVTWGIPNGMYEIIYDDGTFENMTAWLQEGSLNALRFTPAAYPVTILGGSVNIGDGSYPPDGDQLQDFVMGVFDDDGANGYPGTFLGSVDVTPTDFGWVSFDLSSLGITLESGDFYLAMQQGGDWPDCAPIAIDQSNPVYRSYSKFDGAPWTLSGYNDFMIRAVCQGPGGMGGVMSPDGSTYVQYARPSQYSRFLHSPRVSSGYMGEAMYVPRGGGDNPRNLSHYSIYRVNEGDEGNPDAWTLLAGNIPGNINTYTDNAWSSLPDGGYRWAVYAIYSGGTSDPALSNLLGKNMIADVTINVTTSGGESPEGAQVVLANQDGLPEHSYSAICGPDGVVNFPEVWKGTYDLTVALFGYQPYAQNNIDINDDMTINVLLLEITYPPTGLWVDPLTLVANWLPPGVSLDLLQEGWDSYGFTENGWTFDPSQSNWQIYSYDGQPAPCVEFYYYPTIYDYSVSLVSKSMSGLGMPSVWLDFALYFSNFSTSTDEDLAVEVWNGSSWVQVTNFSNQDYPSGIYWTNFSYDITSLAQGVSDFKVRFRAWGANSNNINWWYIDNIMVYGQIEQANRSVMGYIVYLDDAVAGFTAQTTFTYPPFLINWGQTYTAAVRAVYASGVSDPVTCVFTSTHLPPPRELEGEDVGHTAHLTWKPPLVGTQPNAPEGVSWEELMAYNNLTEADLYHPEVTGIDRIGLPPAGIQPIPIEDPNGNAGMRTITSRAFAYNAYPNYGSDAEAPTKFTLINPGDLTSFGPSGAGNFFSGACWGPNDMWYVTRYNGQFGTVDTTTGQFTQISAGLSNPVGLAWDLTTETMYMNTYGNGGLWIIDPATGGTTLVGYGSATAYIDMTVTNEGQLYGLDMNSQYFGTIDKTTGAWAPLIPSPFFFVYAQGMSVDRDEDKIYWAAVNASTYQGQLWVADLVSNTFSFIGYFEGYAEVDGMAIPGGGGMVPDNLLGYNVYRDEALIASVDAETEEYYDQGLMAGWYSYGVTALYGPPTPGESQVEGPIDLYIAGEGVIQGTVTRFGSQPIPIPGATITISNEFDTYTTTTDQNGHYSQVVTEGTYLVCADADTYQSECVEDVFVPFDQTVTVDFQLKEFPYPPMSVSAVRNFAHTQVDVNWYEYSNFYVIKYDDGIADNVTAWDKGGNMNAIRFTPSGYPAQIFGIECNIYNGSWPPGEILTPFQMAIYDDNGPGGLPGTQLAIIDVAPYDFGWVYGDFSLAGVTINSGDFYGVMIQGGDFPNCAPIAIDQTNPQHRSYSQYVSGGEPWRVADFTDFMIRAYVYSGTDGSQILHYTDKIEAPAPSGEALSPKGPNMREGTYDVGFGTFEPRGDNSGNSRVIEYYNLYRMAQGQEGSPDAWDTIAEHITETHYTDLTWGTMDNPKGWYRYAVIGVYTYNESEPAFSNLVPYKLDWDVKVYARINGTEPAVGAQVTLTNENGNAAYVYTGVTGADGMVLLHEVWEGYYTLLVTLPYYQDYVLQHIAVFNNITINVPLYDACLPPQNFTVNSTTGVATWLPPILDYYTVFEEGFEGGSIPPGWTQEYIVQAVSWTVQTGSPSGVPDMAHSGQYNASFIGSSAKTRLVTPEIDLGGALLPRLTFYHTQAEGGGQDELKVYYRVSPTAIWHPLASYIDNLEVWTKEEINLPEPTGHYQLGFMGDNPEPAGLGICLDDILVEAGVNPLGGGQGSEARVLEGYNVYLDGVLMAFTTELTYTYTDLVPGQFYVAGVQAVYTSCNSIMVQYPFTYYPCDYFNQPRNFTGTVSGMDVILTWDPPPGIENVEYLIKYDNNAPDNAMEWYDAGGETAVRFTPDGYPCQIRQFHMYIWDGTWPPGDILNPFRIVIYDDDGGNGYPGTELGEKDVTPENYYWIDFDISDLGVSIGSGDFYLAHYQLGYYPNCPPTGIDGSAAGQGRSYDHAVGVGWGPGQYDQYMIRATVFGPQLGEQVLGPETVHVDGTHTGGAVSVNPAAPIITGDITLGKGEYVTTDDRSRFTLKGYNVYKDNVKINDVLWTSQIYIDHCSPGGIYYYNVTAVWDMGESCFIDPSYEAIVGAEFPPPTDLTAEALEGDDVLLTWNKPGESTGQWIHWDDGENYSAIGLTSAGSFLVASRWAVEDLVLYDGMSLTKIAFFPRGAQTQYALKVWTGENAGTLVLDQPLSSVVLNTWNTVTLTTPVPIDATQELWFGYACIDQPTGEYPAGCDAGPAVAGKGDMLSEDGVTWETLSGYGLDYNWNLQGWVTEQTSQPLAALPQNRIENTGDVTPAADPQKPTGQTSFTDNDRFALMGYNIWRNGDNIQFVEEPDTFYVDPAVLPGTYDYYVSAVYAEGESFADGPASVTIEAKGSVTGVVFDGKTSEPIAGATVTVEGGYTGETGYDGKYTINGIPVGIVTVTATATGYSPKTVSNVEIVYGQPAVVDFALFTPDVMVMPFYEPWDLGSFDTQYWTFDPAPGNWIINTFDGNPAPTAEFNWTPTVTNYSFALVSPEIDATDETLQNVTLTFDLYLSDYGATGLEYLTVDAWDGSQWVNIDEFVNNASIDWTTMSYNISDLAIGHLTRVRFVAHGTDSYQINYWYVDNIRVYEQILATLQGTVTDLAYGNPIEGAKITVGENNSVLTNADGFYSITVEEGDYPVTCEATGYCTVEDQLTITGTTVWDVVMGNPIMTIDPLALNQELVYGDNTATQYLTITNDGNCPLHWNATLALLDKTATPDMQLTTVDRTDGDLYDPSVELSPRVTMPSGNETDDVWDVQFNYDVSTPSGTMAQAGVEFDGTYFYTTVWSGNTILKFDHDGNYIGTYTISGGSQIRDLAYDGTYLYGGSAGTIIYQIDPATIAVIGQIASPGTVRAIAYDPTYDGFWICDWESDIYLVGRDGSMIDVISNPGLSSMYGLAYDNVTGPPSLWIFDQGGSGAMLYQLDIGSGTLTGVTHDVLSDIPVSNAIAGGLFLSTTYMPGTVTLGGLLQGDWDAVFGYELGTYSLWVSLEMNQGNVDPGSSQEIAVYFNSTGLELGDYNAEITFASTPDVGTIVVPVQLAVVEGIEEPFNAGMISIYPNPANEKVNVVVNAEVKEVRMLNYIGQEVYYMNVAKEKTFEINTSHMSVGTYMLEFTATDGSIVTKRLVISR